MTAVRETFEETGLLVVPSTNLPPDAELDEARESIHSRRSLFKDFLAKYHLRIEPDSLLPFTQWITPPTVPRR